MKTNEITDAALDWAVHYAIHGQCEGHSPYEYSTDWAHAGPIIEREKIGILPSGNAYYERDGGTHYSYGPTPLIAAMRAYVASKMGDEIEIPTELLGEMK
jgi:hypothetical protein